MRWRWIGWVAMGVGCDAVRIPVYGIGSEGHTRYERPEDDDECIDDVSCVEGGCGNACVSIDADPFVGSCEAASHASIARCGCVGGRCRWFAHGSGAP